MKAALAVGTGVLIANAAFGLVLCHRALITRAIERFDQKQPTGVWWRSVIDRDVLEICRLAGWWGAEPRSGLLYGDWGPPATPGSSVSHIVQRALGNPKSPNYGPSAVKLLDIVPRLRHDDAISDVLCDLAWAGWANLTASIDQDLRTLERTLAVELLQAVVFSRPFYDNPDCAAVACTLVETMRPAVAMRDGGPTPKATLAELRRCVSILLGITPVPRVYSAVRHSDQLV